MTACSFVTQAGHPCMRWAGERFGSLDVCGQHLDCLERAMRSVIYWGTPLFRRQIREALNECEAELATERAEVAARAKVERQVVYFVERDGFVKIGFTTDLPARLKSLRHGGCKLPDGMTVGPLTLLGTMPGGPDNERFLHRRFQHLRLDGEWFLLTDEVREFIAWLACNRSGAA